MTKLVGHRFVHYVDSSSVSSLSRSPSPAANLGSEALRALDFFHNFTAIELGRIFTNELWSKALACFVHQQPAIRHGVIALASFHENFVRSSREVFGGQRKLTALEHYGKSIVEIVQLNQNCGEDLVLTTLISSLLYCAIESMQGHLVSAMKHIRAGLALLAEQESLLLEQERRRGGVAPGFVHTLRQLFVGLGTQLLSMEDTFLEPSLQTYLRSSDAPSQSQFETVDDALVDLAYLTNDVTRFAAMLENFQHDPVFPTEAQLFTGEQLEQRYERWTLAYHDLLARATAAPSMDIADRKSAFLILRVNQKFCKIVLGVKYEKDQTCFDRFFDDFGIMIEAAEAFFQAEAESPRLRSSNSSLDSCFSNPVFSLSLGVIPAVFFICGRCRDSSIRHRALALLKNNRRRESIWDCQMVARVAETVITIEEKGRGHRNSGVSCEGLQSRQKDMVRVSVQGVPETARVQILAVDFLGGDRNEAEICMITMNGAKQSIERFTWEEL